MEKGHTGLNMKEQRIDYTFIVTTYNQEHYVIQALESIRYQICRYGTDYQIQLIIGDDASSDKTIRLVDAWLLKNSGLFDAVDRLYHKTNIGHCRNYANSIRHIRGRCFREIAGDDILPVYNIFKIMDLTKEYDVVASAVLPFSNGRILTGSDVYRDILRQSLFSSRQLQILTQVYCPVLNGAVWKKELMTEEVLQYIEKYHLIEDRPQWYQIFQQHKNLNYGYCSHAALLYRKEEGTMTHSKEQSPVFRMYQKDMEAIYADIMHNTDSGCIRLFLKWNQNRILKRWNPLIFWLRLLLLAGYPKISRKYNDLTSVQIPKNQRYLDWIIKKSSLFLKEVSRDE